MAMPPTIYGPDGRPLDRDWPEDGLAIPQVYQVAALMGGAWHTYWQSSWDEARKQDRQHALAMENDIHYAGLLQERYLSLLTLKWHVGVDNEKDARQKALKGALERIVRATPFLGQCRLSTAQAIWFGRAANQRQYVWQDMLLPDVNFQPQQGAGAAPGNFGNGAGGAASPAPGAAPAAANRMSGLLGGGAPAAITSTEKSRPVLVIQKHAPVHGDSIGHEWDGTPMVLMSPSKATELQGAETAPSDLGGTWVKLRGSWRERFIVHAHEWRAAEFFQWDRAERVHGVGVRNTLYWSWWCKSQYLTWINAFYQRFGLGLRVWYFEQGNAASYAAVSKAAKENADRVNILVPVRTDKSGKVVGGVEVANTPVEGASALLELRKYMEDQEERYVVGQTLSSDHKGSGGLGGSGAAEFQQNTKLQVTKWDADNEGETYTRDWLDVLRRWCFPECRDIPARWVNNVPDPEAESKLEGAQIFTGLGGAVKEDEILGLIGLSAPEPGDKTLGGQQPGAPAVPGLPELGAAGGNGKPPDRNGVGKERYAAHDVSGEARDPEGKWLAGHPFKGLSRDEQHAHLEKEVAGFDRPTPDPNPRGYDLKKLPRGLDADQFVADLTGAVAEAARKDAFKRPNVETLYSEVGKEHGLSLHAFQGALAKLAVDGVIRLGAFTQAWNGMPNLEHLIPFDRETKYYVTKGDKSAPKRHARQRYAAHDDQARVPAGSPDGGRFTDGAHLAHDERKLLAEHRRGKREKRAAYHRAQKQLSRAWDGRPTLHLENEKDAELTALVDQVFAPNPDVPKATRLKEAGELADKARGWAEELEKGPVPVDEEAWPNPKPQTREHAKTIKVLRAVADHAEAVGKALEGPARHARGGEVQRYSGVWSESAHPRGQPDNAGQFAPAGGGRAGATGHDTLPKRPPVPVAAPAPAAPKKVKKKYGPSKAKVAYWEGDKPEVVNETIRENLGLKATPELVASLVGAPDDATVEIGVTKAGQLVVSVEHPTFTAKRYIGNDDDGYLFIKNDEFFMKPGAQGKGLGSDVFGRQVEQAQEMGIDYIKCHAAKDNPRNPEKPHNGYYTWPRLGYDQSLEDLADEEPGLASTVRKKFPGAKMILDVMRTKEGRDWWKANGTDLFEMRFDLSTGSRSLRVLGAYLEERAA